MNLSIFKDICWLDADNQHLFLHYFFLMCPSQKDIPYLFGFFSFEYSPKHNNNNYDNNDNNNNKKNLNKEIENF